MAAVVRRAVAGDVAAMVGLSEAKRTAYEREQPLFWRKAKDSAERQRPFFETVIARDDSIALVAEGAGRIDGFLIGRVAPAPPVYEPGGLVCTVDDFAVASPDLWDAVGRALLGECRRLARARGGALVVVVSGHHDEPKRRMLEGERLSIASTWHVGPA